MSLRIYQTSALNAHRQLAVNRAISPVHWLSSGLRINHAGDVLQALLSPKMRGQIRGLKQAQRTHRTEYLSFRR